MRKQCLLFLLITVTLPLAGARAGDYGCAQGGPTCRLPAPTCDSPGPAPCAYPPVCVKVYVKAPCKKKDCCFHCEAPPRGEVLESFAVRRVEMPPRSAEINIARQRLGPEAEFERDCRFDKRNGQESAEDGGLSDRQRIARLERDMVTIDGKLNDLLGLVRQQQTILERNAAPPK